MVTRRQLAGVAGLLGGWSALAWVSARAAAADDDAVLLSVQVDAPPGGLLVQEMVRITVRAVFRSQPNQVSLTQPEFVDARWVALGEDEWTHVSLGGPARVMLRRRLAWFAQRSGGLSIGPFTLVAMVLTPDLVRVAATRRTAPFAVTVHPAPTDAGGWWLPARALRLTDTFSAAPARLAVDQIARRVVTVEAQGIEAAQLPPLPPLTVPGVIAFAQPVATRTVLTPDGPVVRATYAWDIKPVNDSPALLPEIRVPWFDTRARSMREAVLPAVRVSLAEAAGATDPPPRRGPSPSPVTVTPGEVAAGVAAFLAASLALRVPLPRWRALLGRRARTDAARAARLLQERQLYGRPPVPQRPPCAGSPPPV